jgi:Amt family ammonium transporter
MQALMLVIIVVWVGVTTGIVFLALKKTIGLRVSEEEEIQGLDVLEHGLQGYSEDIAHV